MFIKKRKALDTLQWCSEAESSMYQLPATIYQEKCQLFRLNRSYLVLFFQHKGRHVFFSRIFLTL